MARKPQVAVEPRPDGRWAVQTDGTSRADSLHAQKDDPPLFEKDSRGNDPRRIKG